MRFLAIAACALAAGGGTYGFYAYQDGCPGHACPLAAAMSGSGSTVFGLFQKRKDAVLAVERLSGSGWRVILTESLGRGDYLRRSRPGLLNLASGYKSRLH